MRLLIVGLIVVAALAAGGTAFMAKRFLDSQKAVQAELVREQVAQERVLVLVADSDLPAGKKLTRGDLRWQVWPEDDVKSEYASAKEADRDKEKPFVGKVVRRGVAQGTPLLAGMVFGSDKPGFLAGALEKGARAVAVSVKADTGAAGFILPGDFVDVIMTFDVARSTNLSDREKAALREVILSRAAETVLRNVRVLAVDQKIDDFENKAEIVKTVTLSLSRRQAEALSLAQSMGTISLALRSLGDVSPADEQDTFTSDIQMSPTLRTALNRMKEFMAAEKAREEAAKKAEEEARQQAREEAERRRREAAARRARAEAERRARERRNRPRPAAKKKQEKGLEIYRGGQLSSEGF